MEFDKNAFLAYLEDAYNGFSGYEGGFLRELTENVIDYGLKHHHCAKDQFIDFLLELLPEVCFGEIAQFMGDCCLTERGLSEKQKWKK